MFDFMDTWSWSGDVICLNCHTPHLCNIFLTNIMLLGNQFHELGYSSISIHVVPWARMQIQEQEWTSITLDTVPWSRLSSSSLHAFQRACMQFHELSSSYICLHAVPWAWMQFHWVPQSSILLCLSSSQELCSACLSITIH